VALSACALACTLATASVARAADVAARPEELHFPALNYEPPRAADYRIVLPNGIVAYLVPDHGVPLVNVQVLWRIDRDLDPSGKEGVADLTTYLLSRGGTKTMTAEQFEDRVAFLGAQVDAGPGGATLNVLSKDIDEGLALLTDALKHPRFQEDRLSLRKEQLLQAMKERNDASASIEDREWGFLLRGEQHWSNRFTTAASINAITAADLRALHDRYVGPKNFILAVSGDFDRAAMAKKLNAAFSGFPTPGENPGPPPAPTEQAKHGWYIVNKDVNQARVSFGIRALQRDDPDYYAAIVMNDILGGGGFASRLVNRIRSDEGLAYQVGSQFSEGVYYAEPWRMVFQSKVRSTAYAAQLALQEINRIRDSLVTEDELATSKNSFIEAFPARFATASAIAGALAREELTGRYQKNPNFFATFRDKIRAVTAQDVQRVAKRFLDPSQFAVVIVGNMSDIMQGDPKHDARIAALAGVQPTVLPLRDPLTMKPLQSP
jgi:zinc protease